MAVILIKAWEGYKFIFEELADPHTKSFPLVAKPYQTLAILAIYLMFVFKWGPKMMKNRKPFDLKNVLIVYNAAQVLTCTYLFYNSIVHAWGWRYKWLCEPVDTSNSEHALTVRGIVYYYYLTKLVDLLDTVFFVLRKKHNQISFLHIYHHTGMVMLIWAAATYYPGGHGTLIGVINCFVHMVMYGYYLVTVINPKAKEYIWWKKRITQLQILQFLWCSIHMAAIVFIPDCAYPRWTSAVFLPQNLFMLVLFIDFYIKAYIKKPTQKAVKTVGNGVKNEPNKSSINGSRKDRNDALNNALHIEEDGVIEVDVSRTENGISLNPSFIASQLEREKDK